MKMKHLRTPFHVKEVAEDGSFVGYGSVFDTVDSYRERVARGAFLQSLNAHEEKGTAPAMLWQHRSDEVIGIYDKMYEDEKGLVVEGRMNLDVAKAREAHSLMKMTNASGARAIAGLSIGFMPKAYEDDNEERIRTLTQVDLWEVSIVTFPANQDAMISEVRAAFAAGEVPQEKDVEAVLRDAGLSRKAAKALMAKGYAGLLNLRDADEVASVQCAASLQRLSNILRGNSND